MKITASHMRVESSAAGLITKGRKMPSLPTVRTRTRSKVTVLEPLTPYPCLHDNVRLTIRYVDPATLLPPNRALRKATKRQIATLKASILEFGFTRPLLVDRDNVLVAGNTVWEAAKALKLEQVPTVCLDHLSPDQVRLYRIMDNRSAELSGWDDNLLRLELGDLTKLSLDYNLNIELSGFVTAEIDKRLDVQIGEPIEGSEKVPAVEAEAITSLGDMWQLGRHVLLCGNALEEESYVRLMGDERAQMVFADAPYNVAIRGNVSAQKHHREFAMASGEMSQQQFTGFLTTTFQHLAAFSVPGSVHFQCMDWRHGEEMMAAGRTAYSELKNLCVWVKDNAGMGSFYRSQHEEIYVWISGEGKPINNFGLGETGRWRSNVWQYAGMNSFGKDRDEALAAHPTVKPVSLVADAIRDCSKRGGIILDPFGGSGTTLLAAEMTGRKARLIELDPLYCDVIIRRWQKRTGQQAIHIATGMSFDDLAGERSIGSSDEEA